MTKWAECVILSGYWATLSSLLLASRTEGSTSTISYTLVSSGLLIWTGIPTSFTTSVIFGYSPFGTIRSGKV